MPEEHPTQEELNAKINNYPFKSTEPTAILKVRTFLVKFIEAH